MNVFGEIKSRVTMHDVCSMLNLSVNRQGFIFCPHHAERTPSCKIYADSFFCFSCQRGGDSIQLVADSLGISPLDAARKIDKYFSLDLMGREGKPAPRKDRAQCLSTEQCSAIYRDVTLDILAECCRTAWQAEGYSENYREIEQIHQTLLESDSTTVQEFKKQHGKDVEKIVNKYRSQLG